MKQLLLSALILFTATLAAQAQSWAPFYPNDTSYYLDAGGKMFGLATVDSIVVSNTVQYKVYRTLEYDSSCFNDRYNINTNKPIWAGAEIHKATNGIYHFFNNNLDTIIIQSLASVGDSWRFYTKNPSEYIEATITGIDTTTVLGGIDSVKTIRLTATITGDTTLSQWDGMELQLSKSNGLVSMPQMLSFPANNRVVTQTQIKPLKYSEVYNYNIGDYFQVKREYNTFGGTFVTVTLKTVLDKVVTNGGNTVTYTFLSETQPRFNIDTIVTTYNNFNDYIGSALPNNAEETGDVNLPLLKADMALYTGPEVALQGKRTTQLWETQFYVQASDTCWNWEQIIYDGGEPPIHFECLGPLIRYSSGVDGITNETLVYYNLCGQQGGSKLILGVEELPETQIKIHPNPANDVVEINNTSPTRYAINLVNLQGQLLQTSASEPASNTQLDVSLLPLGMYIIQLNDGARTYFKKVVVAR